MPYNKKMTLKWKNGNTWSFRNDGTFWYYKDGDDFYRIFLDNNGLWVGKRVENKYGNFSWEKVTGFILETDNGILKF